MADDVPATAQQFSPDELHAEISRLQHELQQERERSSRLVRCLQIVRSELQSVSSDSRSASIKAAEDHIEEGLASSKYGSGVVQVGSRKADTTAPEADSQHAEAGSAIPREALSAELEQTELDTATPVGCVISELRPKPALLQQGADANHTLSGWEIIGKLKSSSHLFPAAGTTANPFLLSEATSSNRGVNVYGYSAPLTGVTASAWHSLPSLVVPIEASDAASSSHSEPLPAMAGPNTDILVTAGGAGDASLRLWRGAVMAGLGSTAAKKHRVAGGDGLPLPPLCRMQLDTVPAMHASGALVAPSVTAFAVSTSMNARAWAATAAARGSGSQAAPDMNSQVSSCLEHWASSKLHPAMPRMGTVADPPAEPPLAAASVMQGGGGVVLTGSSSGQVLAWGLPLELYTQDLSDSSAVKPQPLVCGAQTKVHGQALPVTPVVVPQLPSSAPQGGMWHVGRTDSAQAASSSAHTAAVTGLVSLGEVSGHLGALASAVATEQMTPRHRAAFAGDEAAGVEAVPDSMCLAGCEPEVLAAWYRVRNCPAFASVGEDGWLRVWALHVGEQAARATLVLSCCVAAALQERGVVGSPPCQVYPTQCVLDPTSAPSMCVLVGTSTGHVVKLDILRGSWATHGHIMSAKLAAAMKHGVAALPKSMAAVEPLSELVDRVQASREGPAYTAAVLRAGAITALAMHGSKPLLMAGTSAGWVAAFDSSSLQCQHVFLAHCATQTALVPSPAVPLDPPPAGISQGGVHPYQAFLVAQMYSSLPYDAVHGSGVGGLVVDPTGSVLISTGAADGAVRIWDFASGALMKEFSDTHRASPLPLSPPKMADDSQVWGAISARGGGASSTSLSSGQQESKRHDAPTLNLRGVDSSVCRCATAVCIAPRSLYITAQDEQWASEAATAAGIAPMDRDTAASGLSKLLVFATGGADGVVKLFSARKAVAPPKFGLGGAARSPAGGTAKAAGSSAGRLLAASSARGRRKPSSAARLLSSKRAARGGAAAAAGAS